MEINLKEKLSELKDKSLNVLNLILDIETNIANVNNQVQKLCSEISFVENQIKEELEKKLYSQEVFKANVSINFFYYIKDDLLKTLEKLDIAKNRLNKINLVLDTLRENK
jgi:hypothetical protein